SPLLCFHGNLLIQWTLFKYEYARIMKLVSPTPHDVSKMQAIQKWYPKIKAIENDLLCQLK
ncbi:hypothetical protein, partial [Prevotella sp.]|uniref:hypothetical protein n=1 Tax=Prevotella sp. TaxID=59823 RepID=UPI004028B408